MEDVVYIQWTITQPLQRMKIMPFLATWMDREIVRLSDVSQTEKEKFRMTSLVCGIEKETMQMNLLTKQKETHRLRKRVPEGRMRRKDS